MTVVFRVDSSPEIGALASLITAGIILIIGHIIHLSFLILLNQAINY